MDFHLRPCPWTRAFSLLLTGSAAPLLLAPPTGAEELAKVLGTAEASTYSQALWTKGPALKSRGVFRELESQLRRCAGILVLWHLPGAQVLAPCRLPTQSMDRFIHFCPL